MRFLLSLAFVASVSSVVGASTFNVTCGSIYPEPEDPWNSSVVAEVQRDAQGNITGLFCHAAVGSPIEACEDVFDGGCCPCNVVRGFTPECTLRLVYTDASTSAACDIIYPRCYYGNQCDSTGGAFIDPSSPRVETTAIVKRSKTKHGKKARKTKKAKQAHGCVNAF